MKKIYLIQLDNDLGELWLDENKKPLEYIHANDANWRDYHNFIIKYLGGKLIELELGLTDEDYDKLVECDCKEKFYKVLKDKIEDHAFND